MKANKKHISKDDFQRYLKNQMTDLERNAFEKELQKHPFEAEALDGFHQIPAADLEDDLKDLSGRIRSGKRKNTTRYWAAAATLLLLISSGVIWFQLRDKLPIQEVAQVNRIQKEEIKTQLPETENQEMVAPAEEKDSGTIFSAKESPVPKKVEEKKVITTPVTIPAKKEEAEPMKSMRMALVEESKQEKGASAVSIVAVAQKPDIRIRGLNTMNTRQKADTGSGLSASRWVAGDTKIVWGKVISLGDSQPLPGVSIVEKGTSNGTVSDRNGHFVLKLVKNNDSVLVASFVGMDKKEFYPAGDSNLVVGLEPSQLALDEVVTVAYGVSSESQLHENDKNAQPQNGMNAFRKYLTEQTVLPDDYPEKKVVVKVAIQIDRQGKIISVENANQTETSVFEKTRQILLNGPAWNPEMKNGIPAESKVMLRIVFRKK